MYGFAVPAWNIAFQRNRFHHTTSQLTSALRPRSVLQILAQQCVCLFSAICYHRHETLLTLHWQDCNSLVDKPRLTASQYIYILTFWHRSFTFNSNKSPTWRNSFSVYYPDVCLQLNMFRAFSRPSSGGQWLQWHPLVLPSYRGDSRAVFVVGPAGRPDHGHSRIITTIRR